MNSTTIGDPVYLKLSYNSKTLDEIEEQDQKKVIGTASKIQCRICKGEHFTRSCPFKDTMQEPLPKLETGSLELISCPYKIRTAFKTRTNGNRFWYGAKER